MSERQFTQIENQEEIKRLERNSLIIAIVTTSIAALGGLAAYIFKFSNPATIFPIAIGGVVAILLIRSGRFITANWLIIILSTVSSLVEVFLRSGEGFNRGMIEFVFIGGYALAAMPRSSRGRILLIALLLGVSIIVLDVSGPAGRPSTPQTPAQLVITVLTFLVFSFFIAREFPDLDLRTKISFGILATGGVAVGVLSFFAINRSGLLIDALSNRVETSVNLLAEEQLINTVSSEANAANTSFESAFSQVISLGDQLMVLQQDGNTSLEAGNYRDLTDEMFSLDEGQYVNTLFEPSSVFIPSTVNFTDALARELNVTAYLDFSVPFVIENNPQILGIYYTNINGVITHYPNNGFGRDLPHDYNGTEQPAFQAVVPEQNPERQQRWSYLRQGSDEEGLIVSISTPVYNEDDFVGVITADFKLDKIVEDINAIKVGSSGYAFLIDRNSHIISMPPQGYEFFGLEPEILEPNQEPQQKIFDNPRIPVVVRQVATEMVLGGSGVFTRNIDGSDVFVSYAPLAGKEFSLGIIVPVDELTQPVAATQNEIDTQVQAALQNAAIILIALLAGAILVSLSLGQLISAPLLRLTQTANQILDGDLGAQAEIRTKDETGTLAQAFNAVTTQLRETLAGLEKTVEERTSELFVANLSIERRAKQFQSISQVARTISSTLDFDSLLTQITTVINREFGFYHVGLFLLDTAREYAVLSAANSEGGRVMLARGHRLKVGEKGLVGFVSSTGRPRVALDTGADAVFFNNPDLPETRSEIALPLLAGNNILGVLDVQSTEANAFSQEDIDILTTLADQVSIAIQNARQNEQTQKALAESNALSQQFVTSGWQNFTKRQNIAGIRHTGAKATILYTNKAKGNGKFVDTAQQLKPTGRGAVLSLPIKLRGEVIGSVDVQAPDARQWDQDEMDIVTAIIERAAIAMENARLLTESQKRAAKERTIGEISAKISAQSEVEDLLKIAAQELTRTMPGTEVAIQFKKEESE